MKSKDDILLEQAYSKILLKENQMSTRTTTNDLSKHLREIKNLVTQLYSYEVPEDTVLDFEFSLSEAIENVSKGPSKFNDVLQSMLRLKELANTLYHYEIPGQPGESRVPEDLILELEFALKKAYSMAMRR